MQMLNYLTDSKITVALKTETGPRSVSLNVILSWQKPGNFTCDGRSCTGREWLLLKAPARWQNSNSDIYNRIWQSI